MNVQLGLLRMVTPGGSSSFYSNQISKGRLGESLSTIGRLQEVGGSSAAKPVSLGRQPGRIPVCD